MAGSACREQYGVNLVTVERQARQCDGHSAAQSGVGGRQYHVAGGKLEEFRPRDVAPHLEILPTLAWSVNDLESPTVALVEAILAPRSTLLGQTLRSAHFHEKYGMVVLGIWHAGRPIRTGLSELTLQFGDALLLQGRRTHCPLLQTEPDLIVLDRGHEEEAMSTGVHGKGWLALIIMAGTWWGSQPSIPRWSARSCSAARAAGGVSDSAC